MSFEKSLNREVARQMASGKKLDFPEDELLDAEQVMYAIAGGGASLGEAINHYVDHRLKQAYLDNPTFGKPDKKAAYHEYLTQLLTEAARRQGRDVSSVVGHS